MQLNKFANVCYKTNIKKVYQTIIDEVVKYNKKWLYCGCSSMSWRKNAGYAIQVEERDALDDGIFAFRAR